MYFCTGVGHGDACELPKCKYKIVHGAGMVHGRTLGVVWCGGYILRVYFVHE